jgi:hypothetical protein
LPATPVKGTRKGKKKVKKEELKEEEDNDTLSAFILL